MDDVISRQAAIEAIVNTVSEIGLHDNSEVARYGATFRQHEIIDIIEGMPSAQPERCLDCINFNKTQLLVPQSEQKQWVLECDGEGECDNLYRCPECGDRYGCQEYDVPNFCPNCGARLFAKDINVPNKEGADDE